MKQSRSNHVPTRDELKEHRSKFDEMLKLKAEEQHRNHVNNIRALRKARQVNGLNEDGSVADSEATPMSSPQKSMMTPQKETHSPLKKRNYQTPKNELSSLSPSKSQNNHDGDVGEIPHMDELISKSSMDEGDGVSLGVVGQSSKKSTRSPRAMYNSPRIGKTKSQDANDTSMEKGLDSEPTSPKASPRSPRNHHKLPGSTSRKKMPSRKSMELTDEEDNTSPEEKHGKNKEKFNFTLKEVDVASICPDDWMHRLLASTMSVDDLHGEAPLLD